MEDYFNQPLDVLQKDERSGQGYYVGFKEWALASRQQVEVARPISASSKPRTTVHDHPI